MEKRYKHTGYHYPKYYLVECPKCEKAAIVSFTGSYWARNNVELKCSCCMHKAAFLELTLYKANVKRNCPDCGKSISAELSNLKNPPQEMIIVCPSCGFKAEYTPNISAYSPKKNLNGMQGDPFFGFPLWFQSSVKGNLFWAYNREHLEEIRTYVEADLRERQSSYARTMVAYLPQFIKEAKNREDVLKVIKDLQYK